MFVAFGGVLYGYDTGTISDILAMRYWLDTFSTGYRDAAGDLAITASQSSEIVSLLSVGTFFGALFASPTADILGRRYGLMSWIIVLYVSPFLCSTDGHNLHCASSQEAWSTGDLKRNS